MGNRLTTYVSGKIITSTFLNSLLQYAEYASKTALDAEAASWTMDDAGRLSYVTAEGEYYKWNGIANVPWAGGAAGGASATASYVTINSESALTGSIRHIDIGRGNAHPPPLHASDHQNGGDDEISVEGLSGKLADEQNAGWIKNHLCDDTGYSVGKVLAFNVAGSIVPISLPGGGDMAKAVYDTDDDGSVESADNAASLGGTAASSYALNATLRTQLKNDGANPFQSADNLNCRARLGIFVNGVLKGVRRNLDLKPGTSVTITGVDNVETETVEVTINSTGGEVGGFGQAGTNWYCANVSGVSPITVTHNLNSTNVAVLTGVFAVQPYSAPGVEVTDANHVKLYHSAGGSLTISVLVRKLA